VNPLYTKLVKVKDIPYYVDSKFLRTLNRDRYQLAQVERMVENAYENYLVEECNVQRKTKKMLLAEIEKKQKQPQKKTDGTTTAGGGDGIVNEVEEELEKAKVNAQQYELTRCVELNDLFPLRHAGRKR
jgi:hypothetical protein